MRSASLKAMRLFQSGRHKDALPAFKRALARDSSDPRLHANHALCLAECGRYGEAVRGARQACQMDPRSAVFSMFLGQIHLDHGLAEAAWQAFAGAAELDPTNSLPRHYMLLADWDRGARRPVVDALRGRGMPQSTAFEGRLLLRVERALGAPARSVRGTAAHASPREARRQAHKALRLAHKGRLKPALSRMEDALDLAPREADVRRQAAELQAMADREAQGAADGAERTHLLHPLACLELTMGERASAGEHMRRWLEAVGPRNAGLQDLQAARYVLATAEQAVGNEAGAAEHWRSLRALLPREPLVEHELGKCLLRLGRPKEARRVLESLLEKAPLLARMRLRTLAARGAETKQEKASA
jgi:tetratricopeptide (TPR) repeat protein